jgi:hypothetical protein
MGYSACAPFVMMGFVEVVRSDLTFMNRPS